MGWDSNRNWKTKQDVVSKITADLKRNYTVLGIKTTKSGVWAVVQRENTTPFIILDLIEKENGAWYVKGMSECEGPFYYDCPREFLAMAPPANENWRKVMEE
jgi:hypothetical protein